MATMVKTLLGSIAELRGGAGTTPTYNTSLTINAKYGIAPTTLPATLPVSRYVGVGIGGRYSTNSQGVTKPYNVDPREMDLYIPLPIRMVEAASDLSTAERANYRGRQAYRSAANIDYILYWLKVANNVDTEPQVTTTDPVTHEETPYVLDPAWLTPTPKIPTTSGTVGSSSTEINVTISSTVTIYASEVLEAINAMYDGRTELAVISELGLYYGTDFQNTAQDHNGVEFRYTEASMIQLGYKICSNGHDLSDPATFVAKTIRQGTSDVILL